MRSQTINATSDAQELLAGPVDPTGWLAGPRAGQVARSRAGNPSTDTVLGVGLTGIAGSRAETRTGERSGTERRAGHAASPSVRRAAGNTDRTARRSARARQLRRVRGGADRQVWLEQDVAAAEPMPVRGQAVIEADAGQGYRMGQWARLTLTLTVLAAVVVIGISLTAGSAPSALVNVTVTPGDTLWSIATQASPDRDPRDVIDEIRQLNDVTGAALPVGVVLRVPVPAE